MWTDDTIPNILITANMCNGFNSEWDSITNATLLNLILFRTFLNFAKIFWPYTLLCQGNCDGVKKVKTCNLKLSKCNNSCSPIHIPKLFPNCVYYRLNKAAVDDGGIPDIQGYLKQNITTMCSGILVLTFPIYVVSQYSPQRQLWVQILPVQWQHLSPPM